MLVDHARQHPQTFRLDRLSLCCLPKGEHPAPIEVTRRMGKPFVCWIRYLSWLPWCPVVIGAPGVPGPTVLKMAHDRIAVSEAKHGRKLTVHSLCCLPAGQNPDPVMAAKKGKR